MRRFLWWTAGILGLSFCGFLGVVGYVLTNFDLPGYEITPFNYVHHAGDGFKVIVSGERSMPWDGDYSDEYKITLRHPNGKTETVDSGSSFMSPAPSGPFHLERAPQSVVLFDETMAWSRPIGGGSWSESNFADDRDLLMWGRAIMPDRYAHNEKFDDDRNRLPAVPPYKFERWNSKSNRVVLLNIADLPSESNWHDQSRLLWPRRLVFTDWKFDPQKTSALQSEFTMRPFPSGVQCEITALDFADAMAVPTGDKKLAQPAQTMPGVRVLWQRQFALVKRPTSFALKSWWDQTRPAPTTLQIRGWCADPNPDLIHFKWRVGNGAEQWEIAHRGEQRALREAGDGVLQAPYLFVRMSWRSSEIKSSKQRE